MFKAKLGIVLVVAVGAALPAAVATAGIYGMDATMEGVRTVGAGLVVDGQTAEGDDAWTDVSLSWMIVDNNDGTMTYTYTLSNFFAPALSHLVVDLTDNAVDDPYSVTHATLNGQPVVTELGDLDGITGAVKFDDGDEGDLVYSFISNRLPVWGDVHAKGGSEIGGVQWGFLWNVGFGDRDSMNASDYIARPDGIVPAPPAVLLGLIGLASTGWLRKRTRTA